MSNLLLDSQALFELLLTIKLNLAQSDSKDFSNQAITKLKTLEKQLKKQQFHEEKINIVKYCFAAAIDEFALQNDALFEQWKHRSLMKTFFQEHLSGERFFLILNQLLKDPDENTQILEVIFILLSLGYKGKLYNKDLHQQKAIQGKIFSAITKNKNSKTAEKHVSIKDKLSHRLIQKIVRYFFTLLVIWLLFNFGMQVKNQKILKDLKQINRTIEK